MSYKDISPEEFAELMKKDDHVVLDVRSPQELSEGEVPGHIMINVFDPTFPNKIAELDKEKAYLLYCRSGGRSSQACNYMAGQGFNEIYNLRGGITAWNARMA